MGKINLNAMKQARKEQEIETPVPEALEQAYANVWGKDKETVQYIELNHCYFSKILFTSCYRNLRTYRFSVNIPIRINQSLHRFV